MHGNATQLRLSSQKRSRVAWSLTQRVRCNAWMGKGWACAQLELVLHAHGAAYGSLGGATRMCMHAYTALHWNPLFTLATVRNTAVNPMLDSPSYTLTLLFSFQSNQTESVYFPWETIIPLSVCVTNKVSVNRYRPLLHVTWKWPSTLHAYMAENMLRFYCWVKFCCVL